MTVTRTDRRRLEAIVADRSAPQKHVWRAHIILATAEGCGTVEIMRRSGKSKPVVWRWQARFMAEGVDGLTRDKTRKPGKQPLPATVVQRVVDLTLGPPPGDATHWTGRMLAKAAGVSLRSVQRILEAHRLAPHRVIDWIMLAMGITVSAEPAPKPAAVSPAARPRRSGNHFSALPTEAP